MPCAKPASPATDTTTGHIGCLSLAFITADVHNKGVLATVVARIPPNYRHGGATGGHAPTLAIAPLSKGCRHAQELRCRQKLRLGLRHIDRGGD